jgi:spore coat protein U-like protein
MQTHCLRVFMRVTAFIAADVPIRERPGAPRHFTRILNKLRNLAPMRTSITLRALTALLGTAGLLGAAGDALASTATTTFTVSATVLKNCTASATNLGFGNYTQGSGTVTSTSTVSVLCTNGTTFTVALNGGTTTGGTIAQRLLAETGGSGTLQYNLYTSNTYATVFGNGTTGSTESGTGAGMAAADAQAFTVYGQLPDNATNQAAPVVGASTVYTDTITVTVTY